MEQKNNRFMFYDFKQNKPGLFNLTLPVQSPDHSGISGRISLTVYVILALDHIHEIKLQSAHLEDVVPLADVGCCP